MRELKFRFIDTGDGTVYKPITLKELCLRIEIPRRIILESENGDFADTDDFLNLLEKGELIADQYTGLKDKNSKEIYEGDIVSGHTPSYIGTFEIAWREDKAGWFGFTTDDYTYPLCNIGHREVIGNIHQNRKLLEEE